MVGRRYEVNDKYKCNPQDRSFSRGSFDFESLLFCVYRPEYIVDILLCLLLLLAFVAHLHF